MTKRALLIGINYVQSEKKIRLSGCIRDVEQMKQMLEKDMGYDNKNIKMLVDTDATNMPTGSNIYHQLQTMIKQSKSDDEFWFHYSGHGYYLQDRNNEENDKKDEIIIPCDYRTNGVITDDLLRFVINDAKCRTFMVFDCCHSGSICDLPYQYRFIEDSQELEFVQQNTAVCLNKNIYKISGCRDDQVSWSLYDKNTNSFFGACSKALRLILTDVQFDITMKALVQKMNAMMKMFTSNQRPTLASSNKDSPQTNFADIIKIPNSDGTYRPTKEQEIERLNAEKQQLQAEKQQLQGKINSLEQHKTKLNAENQQLQGKLDTQKQQYNELEKKYAELQKNNTEVGNTSATKPNKGMSAQDKAKIRRLQINISRYNNYIKRYQSYIIRYGMRYRRYVPRWQSYISALRRKIVRFNSEIQRLQQQ